MCFLYFISFHISANRILLSSLADIERLVLSDAFARLWANIGRRDRTHVVKLNQYCGYSVSVTEWHVNIQSSKQAGRQAGRQAGMQAGKQDLIRVNFLTFQITTHMDTLQISMARTSHVEMGNNPETGEAVHPVTQTHEAITVPASESLFYLDALLMIR
jgi:hypothetical protein